MNRNLLFGVGTSDLIENVTLPKFLSRRCVLRLSYWRCPDLCPMNKYFLSEVAAREDTQSGAMVGQVLVILRFGIENSFRAPSEPRYRCFEALDFSRLRLSA